MTDDPVFVMHAALMLGLAIIANNVSLSGGRPCSLQSY